MCITFNLTTSSSTVSSHFPNRSMAFVSREMLLHHIFWACIALFVGLGLAKNQVNRRFGLIEPEVTYPTIYVDPSSHGNFSTIQSAIDSIPSNNTNWIYIHIKAGVYKEQVTIPKDKPFIYLKGEGRRITTVVQNAHGFISTSPTFISRADNIVAKGLTFTNSYNRPPKKDNHTYYYPNYYPITGLHQPAVAAMISGDKSAFYECDFLGFQNTLYDENGRHYFKHCTIEGGIDFIFGNGQSIYEGCTISVNAGVVDPLLYGYITAQERLNQYDSSGFVFKECNVIGIGKTFLGRPWMGLYSRVVFYNSSLSSIVVPKGWSSGSEYMLDIIGHEDQLTFAEHNCYGLGSNTLKRVSWEKKLSSEMLKSLTSITFIDNEGWIRDHHVPILP